MFDDKRLGVAVLLLSLVMTYVAVVAWKEPVWAGLFGMISGFWLSRLTG